MLPMLSLVVAGALTTAPAAADTLPCPSCADQFVVLPRTAFTVDLLYTFGRGGSGGVGAALALDQQWGRFHRQRSGDLNAAA